jgi:hypothetical protein
MKISIQSLLEGATRATGTVAIIDVFRAFTTAAVALANGASRIVMVSTVEEALALRDAGIGRDAIKGKIASRVVDNIERGIEKIADNLALVLVLRTHLPSLQGFLRRWRVPRLPQRTTKEMPDRLGTHFGIAKNDILHLVVALKHLDRPLEEGLREG